MKPIYKYVLLLTLINVLLIFAGYLLVSLVKLNLHFIDIVILSPVFSIISLITIIIFFRGQTKEPDSQTFHSLVAISLKFLLEIAFALIWFIFAKKTYLTSILMFFVLYLTLSMYSLLIIVKTLKNRSL